MSTNGLKTQLGERLAHQYGRAARHLAAAAEDAANRNRLPPEARCGVHHLGHALTSLFWSAPTSAKLVAVEGADHALLGTQDALASATRAEAWLANAVAEPSQARIQIEVTPDALLAAPRFHLPAVRPARHVSRAVLEAEKAERRAFDDKLRKQTQKNEAAERKARLDAIARGEDVPAWPPVSW